MRLQPNPVFVRLTRNCKWPSGRVALWLGFGLGLVTLFLTSHATLHMKDFEMNPLCAVLFVTAVVLTLLAPAIVASLATGLTARDVSSEPYELVQLTTLPKIALVQGYVFAALYRMRVLISLTVGLIPALVIGVVQLGLLVLVTLYTSNMAPFLQQVVSLSLDFMAIVIGLWGIAFLATASGVGLAIRWRGNILANILVPLSALLAAFSFPLSTLLTGQPGCLLMLGIASIPYLSGVGVMYWTAWWLENHSD
jgi:hypothetical protein